MARRAHGVFERLVNGPRLLRLADAILFVEGRPTEGGRSYERGGDNIGLPPDPNDRLSLHRGGTNMTHLTASGRPRAWRDTFLLVDSDPAQGRIHPRYPGRRSS